jgi:hypothetical protein
MPDDIEQPPRGYNTEDVKAVAEEQPPAEEQPRRRRFSRWKLFLVALVVIPAIVFALWTWAALSWVYSEGERVGWVQKFSRKGWLCKTWEGELAMSNVPGSIPERFQFSVRSDSVARLINDAAGKRVALHYQEHKGVPGSCFAETPYFVTKVRVVN